MDIAIALTRVVDEAVQADCESLRELIVFILSTQEDVTVYELHPFIKPSVSPFNVEGTLARLMQGERKRGYRGANLLRWHRHINCTSIETRNTVSLNSIRLTPKGRLLWRDIQSFFPDVSVSDLRSTLCRALMSALSFGVNSCRQLSLFILCARHNGQFLDQIINVDIQDERYTVIRGRLRALMRGDKGRSKPGMNLLVWGQGDPVLKRGNKSKPLYLTDQGHLLSNLLIGSFSD